MPVTTPSATFSPAVRTVLRKADQRIRSAPRGNNYERYSACRVAMGTLWPVDAFYIGLYRDGQTTVFPYSVMDGKFSPPEVQHFGPRGISAWLLASHRTYRWSDDGGRILSRGLVTEAEQRLRDALVVPMLDADTGQPSGFMGCLSTTPGAFTAESVAAAEWLARAVGAAMRHDTDDVVDIALYDIYPEIDSTTTTTVDDVVHEVAVRLSGIAAVLGALPDPGATTSTADAEHRARAALALCEQAQVDIAQMVARAPQDMSARLDLLTDRERQIALLIAENDCSNSEIAARLILSEKTVKGHVSHILRKLDVRQRSAISWALRLR